MTDPTLNWDNSGATAAGGGGPSGSSSTDAGSTAYGNSDPQRDPSGVSVGELMGDISRDLSTLMRQEVALAKAEIKQEASKAAQGAGMLGGAGLAGYFLVLFLSLALAWALSGPIGAGWAHLIVGVLWGIAAAVLFVLGRSRLQQVNPKPEQTVETVGEIPSALKPNS